MKLFLQICFIFVFGVVLAACGGNTESALYTEAIETNTVGAYEAYLAECPSGKDRMEIGCRMFVREVGNALDLFYAYLEPINRTGNVAPSGIEFLMRRKILMLSSKKYAPEGDLGFVHESAGVAFAYAHLNRMIDIVNNWDAEMTSFLDAALEDAETGVTEMDMYSFQIEGNAFVERWHETEKVQVAEENTQIRASFEKIIALYAKG